MHVDQIQQNCKNRTHTNPEKNVKTTPKHCTYYIKYNLTL